jgi:hypothetical protein
MSELPANDRPVGVGRVRARTAGLEAAFRRIGLPVWFVVVDLIWVAQPAAFGVDARHYQRAANVWLSGGNPWTVTEFGFPYAAGPHTLALYVPTSLLPLPVSIAIWMGIGLAASIWLVRRLNIPLWWVLFPPLAHAIWNGNPQTIVLALLILGTAIAGTLAAIMKLYALLPLAFHPRRLLLAVVVLAVTAVLLPWQLYLDEGLGIGTHVATAWNGSAWRVPILVPVALLALWILRRDGGEWFSVPAVMPATQFYYVSMVLPVVASRPLLAAIFATPAPLLAPLVVIALAAEKVWRDRVGARDGSLETAKRPALAP